MTTNADTSPTDTQALLLEWYRRQLRALQQLLAPPADLALAASDKRKLDLAAADVALMLAENAAEIMEAQYRQVGPLEPANCKSCGAAIIWVTTAKGRPSPLDAARRAITTKDGHTYVGHESHFSSCPSRDRHRMARK